MTVEAARATETRVEGLYSRLDLLERNEYLKEELKVCRKRIEELEAQLARLTNSRPRMAEGASY